MSELYRDFIDGRADEIINRLGGTITPAPANAELYRDFLDRKFDDVVNACNGLIKYKSFTYTGNGASGGITVAIPEDLNTILSICGDSTEILTISDWNLVRNYTKYLRTVVSINSGSTWTANVNNVIWGTNSLRIVPLSTANGAFNGNNIIYTVYYI